MVDVSSPEDLRRTKMCRIVCLSTELLKKFRLKFIIHFAAEKYKLNTSALNEPIAVASPLYEVRNSSFSEIILYSVGIYI